jgi:hypothetical protein
MGIRSNVVIVLASLCLFACGSAKSGGEAKGPESNPWADYKGTYATAGASSTPSPKSSKVAKAEEPTPAPAEEPAAVEEAPAAAPTPAPAKKAKGGGGKAAPKKKK